MELILIHSHLFAFLDVILHLNINLNIRSIHKQRYLNIQNIQTYKCN